MKFDVSWYNRVLLSLTWTYIENNPDQAVWPDPGYFHALARNHDCPGPSLVLFCVNPY